MVGRLSGSRKSLRDTLKSASWLQEVSPKQWALDKKSRENSPDRINQ